MLDIQTGFVVDVEGLRTSIGSSPSVRCHAGYFQYHSGQKTSFWIGDLRLGCSVDCPVVTILDFADGPRSVQNTRLINRVRLLLSLGDQQGFEKTIVISTQIEQVVSKYASRIDLDTSDPHTLDNVLVDLGSEIGVSPKTVEHARNHVRRALAGFKVLRDIQIPMRDGHVVSADIHLPLHPVDRYPVLAGCTTYGKRIVYSSPDIKDHEEVAEFERAEDTWFSTPPGTDPMVPHTTPIVGRWSLQRRFETIGTFNTYFWVPRGYVVVKVDPRGVGSSPGTRFDEKDVSDLCDTVEWAAVQPWSTGSVALGGNSNGANVQWAVARRKPRGLKCIIPFATDIDSYRDIAYPGGISLAGYLKQWLAGVRGLSPRWSDNGHAFDELEDHPFDSSYWTKQDPVIEDIDVPLLTAASQVALVHSRGAYEVWRRVKSKHKYLQVVDGNYYSWPNHECASKILKFADRFLKGVKTDLEPVGLQMRLGHQKWYWRTENDWPVPGTEYIKWYLHADQTLALKPPDEAEKFLSYSAEARPTHDAGLSFVSEPLKHDMEIAGHFWAKLHISSSTSDADVVVLIWAIDEAGKVVSFCVRDATEPLNSGALRVSHRKLDQVKSLPYRPYHTHTAEDHAPLREGEIAEVLIELPPATARLKAGWKIQIDVCPSEAQPAVKDYIPRPYKVWPDDVHKGATNAIHFGGSRENYVVLPRIPFPSLAQQECLESVEY
ncbi:putative serine esterase [Pseudocercospora fuligena]|uniref:Putative serine esterase n=1 Tax=Pseudocercospora fuligena TaxID=685502 RepID=A0A8H6RN43_9PEZI|nr:putative serine esterase [Pseudocercospora fuligena]